MNVPQTRDDQDSVNSMTVLDDGVYFKMAAGVIFLIFTTIAIVVVRNRFGIFVLNIHFRNTIYMHRKPSFKLWARKFPKYKFN